MYEVIQAFAHFAFGQIVSEADLRMTEREIRQLIREKKLLPRPDLWPS